ncbi:MAG: hypothetical protein ACRDWI_20495, partial [Jiangellaceae bacterium]
MPAGQISTTTRRSMLFAMAVATLAACTGDPSPAPAPTVPPPPQLDDLLRGEVAAAERSLLLLYAATTGRHPGLEQPLAAYAARHRRHLRAVEGSGPVAAPTPPASTGSPTPSAPAATPS